MMMGLSDAAYSPNAVTNPGWSLSAVNWSQLGAFSLGAVESSPMAIIIVGGLILMLISSGWRR